MNTNRMILDQLISVPNSQLSLRFRIKCKEFDGTDEKLIKLFEEIYNGCCESSSFIKQLVNPEFTRKYLDTDDTNGPERIWRAVGYAPR